MLTVTFYRDPEGTPSGVQVSGHASYADKGEDIVCAAVSALVTNTVNSLEKLTDDNFTVQTDESSALIELSFTDRPSLEADLLMRSLAIGLTSIESEPNYQTYIDVIFEEA